MVLLRFVWVHLVGGGGGRSVVGGGGRLLDVGGGCVGCWEILKLKIKKMKI